MRKFASLKGIETEWKTLALNYTKQKSSDLHNCGVYVAQYLKRLISANECLIFGNTDKQMLEYRSEMNEKLLTSCKPA